jgi:hypothetical protein
MTRSTIKLIKNDGSPLPLASGATPEGEERGTNGGGCGGDGGGAKMNDSLVAKQPVRTLICKLTEDLWVVRTSETVSNNHNPKYKTHSSFE